MKLRASGTSTPPRILSRKAALALAFWLVPAIQTAQEAPAPETPASQSLEKSLEARIQQTESSTDLDEALKNKILEAYRTALTHIRSYSRDLETLSRYEKLVQTGPEQLRTIREELKAPAEDSAAFLAGISTKTSDDLRASLIKEEGLLASVKGDLAENLQSVTVQQDRPGRIREELSQAREKLAEIETELKTPRDLTENPELKKARSELLNARKLARSTEIKKLEQELVIYEVRLNLLKAHRDRNERLVNEIERRIASLQEVISSKRRAEAAQVQAETEQASEAVAGKHRALVRIASENERLSGDLKRLTGETEETRRALQEVDQELTAIRDAHKSAKEKLGRVGLTGLFGDILVEQRRKLPELNELRRGVAGRRVEISRLRVEEMEIEEKKRWIGDFENAVNETIAGAREGLDAAELATLEADARTLLRDQASLLDKLEDEYVKYLNALGNLDYKRQELTSEYRQYASFIDEHLLWTPSTTALGPPALARLPSSLAWFGSAANWRSVVHAERVQLSEHAWLSICVGLLVLGLLLSRKWLLRRLNRLAEPVGKRYADSFLVTLFALLVTLAVAAPMPIVVAYAGWLIAGTLLSPFASAVGEGLLGLGGMLFILQGYRVFCQKSGVAAAHFKWSERSLSVLRGNLRWLIFLGLPLLFVVTVTEFQPDDVHRNTLGRTCFVAGMLLVAAFTARVLAPARGALGGLLAAAPESWLFRLRHLWYPIAVLLPLAIAAIAGVGYYYTALELDHRVLSSALIVVGGIIIYHLIVRWLLIARRRLALARAREKRAAQLAAQGEQQPDELVDLDVPEIDLATIKRQTHGIVRTAIVLAVLVSLTTVWAGVLPALGVLDKELWTVSSDGGESLRSITTASVLLSGIILLFSFVSARNLPGLLEISVARRLPFDPGSRYAVSTIGQYLVVAIGLVLASYTIGIGWSHVQWLVAALGVGLGFGLQEIFANFVSGLIILLERPIRVGDTVTIGQVSGTVTRIRIRATTITDWDQKELVVPNKSFITGELVNWSLSNPVTRLVVNVGIAYGSDTELALKCMLQAAEDNPRVLDEPEPSVFFVGFGDSALNFEVRVFVKELSNRARSEIIHELHMKIDRGFREKGIVIAFPQRDLHIKSDERSREASSPFADKYGADLS